MGTEKKLDIIIIAENNPRSESIASLILNGFKYSVNVNVQNLAGISAFSSELKPDVNIVDLVSSTTPIASFIAKIRKILPESALIALHMYKSPELIKPLYDMGIDGYLYSDPSRDELVRAIEKVVDGQKYYPPFYHR